MKKAIIGIIVAVVLLIIIGIGVLVVKDFKQEDILRQEMLEFENLTRAENIDLEAIDQKIREIKTTGDYGVLEKAMKDYLADVLNASIDIANILRNERIVNVLTPENYIEDGQDFEETKRFLEESKNKIEEYKSEILTLMTNEGAMSYIENKNLDEYYIDLYKEIALSEETELEKNNSEMEESLNEVVRIIDIKLQIVSFLSENKDAWEIQGENIIFNNEDLQNQYNEYINQI